MSAGWLNVDDAISGLTAQAKSFITGLIPNIYPPATNYPLVANSERIFANADQPGSQSTDPRASEGYGTAHQYMRAPEGTFNPRTYVGGSNYTVSPASSGFQLSLSNLVVLAAVGFALFVAFKKIR